VPRLTDWFQNNLRLPRASSILDWLKSSLRDVKLLDLPLEFHVDTDEEGRHITRVLYRIDDETTWVKDVAALWNYGGFSIERGDHRYVVSTDDLDTLLALRSICTEISPTGELISPICPPILRHLRQKRSLKESESSKEYEILDTPLEIGARLDFDPRVGLITEVGYQIPGQEELIPQPDLKVTPDGRYAQVGKRFTPLPKRISDAARDWLHKVREVIAPDRIPEFFKRDLVLLKTDFQAVLTDDAARLQVLKLPPSPQVRVRSDERGWLEFQMNYVVGDHEVPFDLIRKAQGAYVQPDPYTFIEVPPDAGRRIESELAELGAEETPEGYRIPVAQFGSLEDFIDHIGGQREVDAAYQQFLDDLEGFEADEAFSLSEAAEEDLRKADIRLRPYQRAGIHWLTWLADHHLHGLLADDMGLGKTIQTAAALRRALEENRSRHHSLIVCPKSVIRHWHRELRRCYPSLRIYEYTGYNRDRGVWHKSYPGVVISTYDTVARDVDLIAEVPLFFLVVDESTKIKNPQTQRAQAVKALNAAHRIALSGTPVENRPAELWSVFDFLIRGHLGRYGAFQRVFEAPILNGNQAAADRLGKRVGPFLLRRRKGQVAKDLPEKVEMESEWVELTDEQRKLYAAIQSREAEPVRRSLARGAQVGRVNILAILTKLKQVCDHPALITRQMEPIEGRSEKFDRVLELMDEILEQDEQIVLFSHFLNTLDLFQAVLTQREAKWIRLDGSVSMDERQRRIDWFNGGQAQVALCSLQAVGHGVNLAAANHVIHVDRWWNPAIEDQATDRVHRIGQEKTVFVHRILTADTLEEKIATLLERKRELSDQIMGAAAQQQLRWTREELLELLKPLE
jgi:superfamily II DNA or RNA helicase